MKFLDYEKIIKDNYPILIESYVKQYGEEYRGRITSVLERLSYCFFITPENIVEYVETKEKEDCIKAILDGFDELGIDVSSVYIDEEEIVFNDPKVAKLISIYFPDLEHIDMIKEKGVFAFRSEYDNLEWDNPIILERLKLLEELKKKRVDILDKDYVKTYEYKSNCLFMRQYLKVFERNFDKWQENYDELLEYADDVDEKVLALGRCIEKEYLKAIKEHLSKEDQELIDSGIDFELTDLDGYGIHFDLELSEDGICLSEGPIDYFHPGYTESLLDEEVTEKEKQAIVDMRLLYLESVGFDTSLFEGESLFCDWYEREDLKEILPNTELVEKLAYMKDELYELFEYEGAKMCIINDFELAKDDAEIGTIMEGCGHSCSIMCRDGKVDTKTFSNIICLNPFMSTYNLFDIAIDHELRHAIEMRMKKQKDKILLKTGCDLTFFDSKLENGTSSCTDLNERITQKLSVEATADRWKKGQFIFSDKYALKTLYPCSVYDLDLDNLDIIFEPFRDEIINAQISPSFNQIYSTIPRRTLEKIDSLITDHSVATTRKLKNIRRGLIKRKINKDNNSYINKSNNKVKKKGKRNG